MKFEKYVIVIDTNLLHQSCSSGADFTYFNLNKNFKKVASKIEENDMLENIAIAIPEVVWKELKQHAIENYNKYYLKIEELKKYTFPSCTINIEDGEFSYEEYIEEKIKIFKDDIIKESYVEIVEIPLPSKEVFTSIMERVFYKRPPFEGNNKESDKGFKDALIWESILEYKRLNPKCNIVFCTEDKNFNEELCLEYSVAFNNEQLYILPIESKNDELNIITHINNVALQINPDTHIVENEDEFEYVVTWLKSDDFLRNITKISNIFSDTISDEILFNTIEDLKINSMDTYENDGNNYITANGDYKIQFGTVKKDNITLTYNIILDIMVTDETTMEITDVHDVRQIEEYSS